MTLVSGHISGYYLSTAAADRLPEHLEVVRGARYSDSWRRILLRKLRHAGPFASAHLFVRFRVRRVDGKLLYLLWAPSGVSQKVGVLPWRQVPGGYEREASETFGFPVFTLFQMPYYTPFATASFRSGGIRIPLVELNVEADWRKRKLQLIAGW